MVFADIFNYAKSILRDSPQANSFMVFFLTLAPPTTMIAALIISLVFISKNKSWAYLIAAVISFYVSSNSVNYIIGNDIPIQPAIIIPFALWSLILILSASYYFRTKIKKQPKT